MEMWKILIENFHKEETNMWNSDYQNVVINLDVDSTSDELFSYYLTSDEILRYRGVLKVK